jgi:hypothetical protein
MLSILLRVAGSSETDRQPSPPVPTFQLFRIILSECMDESVASSLNVIRLPSLTPPKQRNSTNYNALIGVETSRRFTCCGNLRKIQPA